MGFPALKNREVGPPPASMATALTRPPELGSSRGGGRALQEEESEGQYHECLPRGVGGNGAGTALTSGRWWRTRNPLSHPTRKTNPKSIKC